MRRTLTPEIMDDPSLDPARHRAALAGLARLNRAAAVADVLWPSVRDCLDSCATGATLLDIASGSADIPTELADRARRAGRPLRVTACDVSDLALDVARERAARRGLDLVTQTRNALSAPFPSRFDIVTCNLFCHHLSREAAVTLLRHAALATRRLLLVTDLRRDSLGLALALIASRALTRSRVVHTDAIKSVRAAFSRDEFAAIAADAGLAGADIRPIWPRRMLLSWRP